MNNRAAVTVEASLVISLFLFTVLALVQMGYVIVVNKHIYTAFAQAVEETASDAYGWQTVLDERTSSVAYVNVYSKLKKKLKDDLLVSEYVSGELGGVLLTSAGLTEDGFIEAELHYYVQLNIPFIHSLKAGFRERQKQKAYIGYRKSEAIDTYVYVTDYQSVYHSSRSCSHLSLHISEVSKQVALHKGSGLAPCSFCKNVGDRYYITKQGDCYHTSLACPGLTRTIYRVKKQSVKGLMPCSRCN